MATRDEMLRGEDSVVRMEPTQSVILLLSQRKLKFSIELLFVLVRDVATLPLTV